MRHYETIFLLKPTLTEEETKNKIETFKKVITDMEGEIVSCDDMGLKKLAYEVKGHKKGYYFVIYFTTANTPLINELERLYKINEEVLKFMTIKFVKQAEIKAWKQMSEKAKNPQANSPQADNQN